MVIEAGTRDKRIQDAQITCLDLTDNTNEWGKSQFSIESETRTSVRISASKKGYDDLNQRRFPLSETITLTMRKTDELYIKGKVFKPDAPAS